MHRSRLFFLFLLLAFSYSISILAIDTTIVWNIDTTQYISGQQTQVLGSPQIINTAQGKAVEFGMPSGDLDQLCIDANPLTDAAEFTIEVIFMPYAPPTAIYEQPRFFHIEDSIAGLTTNKRITIEARFSANKQQWYLDAFLKSTINNLTLIDASLLHPMDQWANAAITYQSGNFTSYVNGVQELAGTVSYEQITGSNVLVSLGARLNKVNYFCGAIKKVIITHRKLNASEFDLSDITPSAVNMSTTSFDAISNYPNPCASVSTVTYHLPVAGGVSLALYDITGRNVYSLVNEYQKGGTYLTSHSVATLPPGLYYYVLRSSRTNIISRIEIIH